MCQKRCYELKLGLTEDREVSYESTFLKNAGKIQHYGSRSNRIGL